MSRYSPQDEERPLLHETRDASIAAPESAARIAGRNPLSVAEPGNRTPEWRELKDRSHLYRLRDSAYEAMLEIGKFRVINEADLTRLHYREDERRARQDVRSLATQGLVERTTVDLGDSGRRLVVVSLTKTGARLLSRDAADNHQVFYSGIVKPRELVHDSAIYGMYQKAVEELRKQGCAITRVVLDHELKRAAFSHMAGPVLSPTERNRRRIEAANKNSLPVINDRISFPDLRIEYRTQEGELKKLDLELTTRHYKNSHTSAKRQAGFAVYKLRGGSGRTARTPVRDDHDITGEALDL